MKAFLMYKDRDFNLNRKSPPNEQILLKDLELPTLFGAMAHGDEFLMEVVQKAVLTGLMDTESLIYRQNVLRDCLKNTSVIRDIYNLIIESIEYKKKNWLGVFIHHPSSILQDSVEMLQMYVGLIKKLKNIIKIHAHKFDSQGFLTFFDMIKKELDDEYLSSVESNLAELSSQNGILLSAELGKGNEGSNYIFRKPNTKKKGVLKRFFGKKKPVYVFRLHPRDEGGFRFLTQLKERSINDTANMLAQAADHFDDFYKMLRIELAFYIACVNLYEQLALIDEPVCFPVPAEAGERRLSFKGLYDVCLALTVKRGIIGNDLKANHKNLVIITGANEGGKSTFLRSVGLAQMMMQCGMFVSAESFSADICDFLFTHYKREEDSELESGKFDEELYRMSEIADMITSRSLLLCNESLAATNELEGSEIAAQIIGALRENGVKIFFVTHLFKFTHDLYNKNSADVLFLRAERKADGKRTFKIKEGEPFETGFGPDLYKKVFGTDI